MVVLRGRKVSSDGMMMPPSPKGMRYSMDKASPRGPLPCDECRKTFKLRSLLVAHKKSAHKAPKPFKCKLCPKTFKEEKYLRIHERIHDERTSVTCDICSQKFPYRSNLLLHRQQSHFSSTASTTFSTNSLPHSKNASQDSNVTDRKLKTLRAVPKKSARTMPTTFKCKFCSKIFKKQAYLQVHKRIHDDKTAVTCNVCFQKFPYVSTLRIHQLSHLGYEANTNIPVKVFPRSRNASQNSTITQMGGTPKGKVLETFKCNLCPKAFKREANLKTHVCMHQQWTVTASDARFKAFPQKGKRRSHQRLTHFRDKYHERVLKKPRLDTKHNREKSSCNYINVSTPDLPEDRRNDSGEKFAPFPPSTNSPVKRRKRMETKQRVHKRQTYLPDKPHVRIPKKPRLDTKHNGEKSSCDYINVSTPDLPEDRRNDSGEKFEAFPPSVNSLVKGGEGMKAKQRVHKRMTYCGDKPHVRVPKKPCLGAKDNGEKSSSDHINVSAPDLSEHRTNDFGHQFSTPPSSPNSPGKGIKEVKATPRVHQGLTNFLDKPHVRVLKKLRLGSKDTGKKSSSDTIHSSTPDLPEDRTNDSGDQITTSPPSTNSPGKGTITEMCSIDKLSVCSLPVTKEDGVKIEICNVCHQCSSVECRCGRASTSMGNLSEHAMEHKTPKIYPCRLCGKQFLQNSELEEHFLKHTTDGYNFCSQNFSEQDSSNAHVSQHITELKLFCQFCHKPFFQQCDLDAHRTDHIVNQNYPCETCDLMFLSRADLEEHLAVHGGEDGNNHQQNPCSEQ